MDVEEFFEHQGVKGMHWGVRKDQSTSVSSRKASGKVEPTPVLTKTFKSGDSVSIYKNPTPFLARQLGRVSSTINKNNTNSASFTLRDNTNHKVGEAGFTRTSKDELSLDWIGVRSQYRGKGYASAALQGVVKYAQNEGIKKLTLEVPGESPDARHIYEKLGFRPDVENQKKLNDDPDLFWGGLTAMSLSVDSIKHSITDEDLWEQQYADEFAQMLSDHIDSKGVVMAHSDKVDEFFEHQGVKGMHWGVRKDGSSSSGRASAARKIKATPTTHVDHDGKVKFTTDKALNRQINSGHAPHTDALESKALKSKAKFSGLDSLSNKEIQTAVTRMNLEQQYQKLSPGQLTQGKKFASDTLVNSGKEIAKDYVKTGLKAGIKVAAATAKTHIS